MNSVKWTIQVILKYRWISPSSDWGIKIEATVNIVLSSRHFYR